MTKRHIPLVTIAMLAVLLLIFSTASADMSTNLRIDAVKSPSGLLTSETYVNDAGDPVIASDKGYATIKYSYGTGKTVTGIELLDTEGNLINGSEGYARIANVYNGKTRIEQRYYDKDGNLVNGPQGYARQETKGLWSDRRSTWEYDKDGNPVNLHRITEYTSYGLYRLITSDSWYDTNDKLAEGPDGYARVENEYLGAAVTKTAYLDKDGKPYYNAKAGYATLVREFEKSVERSLNYYGTKGERIPGPEGYSYALFSYRNGIKRSMWYNADGTLWYNKKGICGIEIAKNYRGQVVEEYYFTGEDQRGKSTDGYSGVNRKYSKYRKLAMEKYLDENDKQMVVESLGYARVLNTISNKKYKTREEYYDENNKLTINTQGYSIAIHKYDRGQLMESNYYDTDGKTPVNIKDGYARVTYERDEENNVVRTNWYDAEGNPCPGPSGVEEVRNTWGGKNKATESYWKANGNPDKGPDGVNAIQMEYNGAGKVTKKTLLGAGNRVIAGKDGYAIVETEYNSEGGVMCVKYYDADGQLMLAPGKEFAYERTTLLKDLGAMGKDEGEDEEGIAEGEEGEEEAAEEEEAPEEEKEDEELEITEEIEENNTDEERETVESATDGNAEEKAQKGVKGSIIEYYGIDGQLMTLKAGYAIIERKNNSAGKVAEESYYSVDREPVTLAARYAKIEREYDSFGALSKEAYFGMNGEPVTLVAGYQYFTRVNDNKGNALKTAYFDAEGKPVINSSIKAHRVDKAYLDAKHVLSEAWFDTTGKACVSTDTYAKIEREFDRNGNTISEKTFDTKGKAICRNAGYDETQWMYNEKNQAIQIQYRKDARLTEDVNGVAVIQRKYDDAGNIAEEWYLDRTGLATTSQKTKYHRIVKEYLDAKHVISEKYYDAWGEPTTAGDTFVQIRREFDEKGNTIREYTYGPFRRPIARNAGYDEVHNTFNDKNQVVRIEYFLDGKPVLNSDGVAIIEREYDEAGLVTVESYYGTQGEPVLLDGSKYHRIERTWLDKKHATSEAWFDTAGQPMTQGNTFVRIDRQFDENGNTIDEITYGADGQPIARNAGYDEVRNTYNEKNRTVKTEYLLDGKPVLNSDGVAIIEREYDENGLVAVESYFGTAGEPVQLSGNKYHRINRTWLDKKHITSEAWFDVDGQPMPQGDTYVRIERTFDALGNTLTEITYDGNGQPIARNAGYDEVRNTFNEKNQAVKIEYLLGGKPVLNSEGVAIIEREYDEAGLVAVESYYGVSGEPVLLNGNKYHRIDRTWLDKKHATSESWFDVDGQPMTQGDTFVRVDRQFDENGNTIDEITYGTDGQPIARKAGYDETRNTFNEKNQAVKIEYHLGGKPVLNSDGAAIIEREYDEAGLVAVECYYGVSGEPVLLNGNKYHRIDRTWLDKKHATSEAWFGVDGQPKTQGDTFVRIDRQFDENGNTVDEITYGEDGQPIARKAGYDEVRNTFNEKNQVVKIEYLLGGKPVLNSDGVAIVTREYDEAGLVAVECYYGTENEPVLLTGKNKYHRIERTWLDKKHATSEAWFGTDGKPITLNNTYVRVERTFDEAGNCTDERYYGADGAAIACNAGYDEVRNTFNEKNQAIKIEYLLGGALVLNSDGVATVEREFDEAGLVAVESYFGTEGEPIALTGKNKYHRIERTWMDSKHATSEAWFDVDGQPMALRDTYVKVEREFDEKGNCTEERYYGPDGKPIACKAGYDTLKQTFNDKNQAIEISYFLGGAPYTVKNKYAMLEREYDDAGNVSVERYFDGDRKPVICRQGYAEIRMGYNDKKQVIRESWFDTEGKPMTIGDTYCGVEKEYDEAGNVSVMRFLDAEGQPTACKAGYEMVWKRYNEKKKVIYESYMDHTGAPMKNNKGVYQTTYDYDENGKVVQEQYLDENGQLMKNSDGFVRVIRTWNEDGSLASEEGRED